MGPESDYSLIKVILPLMKLINKFGFVKTNWHTINDSWHTITDREHRNSSKIFYPVQAGKVTGSLVKVHCHQILGFQV